MTRKDTQLLPPAMALLVILGGCTDLSPPLATIPTAALVTTTPAPTPSRSPTPSATSSIAVLGTVRGFVSDISSPSMMLGGAKVSLGTSSVLTSDGAATAVDDNGKTFTLRLGEYWISSVPSGEHTLSTLYDDATATTPVTIKAGLTNVLNAPDGVNSVSTLSVPTLGPVSTGSIALSANFVLHGNGTTIFPVVKASGSVSLSFPSPTIDLRLKAPPNSRGDTVSSYVFTYLGANDVPLASASLPIAITPCTVPPATYNHSTSVVTLSNLNVEHTSDTLFNNWTFNNNFATLKIDLYGLDGHRLVGRDGSPLAIRIPCQLTH